MRAAIIENGVVTNAIEVDDLSVLPNLVNADHGGGIGDHYADGVFSTPTPVIDKDQFNAPILEQLDYIDAKSIRALRENDQTRIADLENQAAALRLQLMK